MAEMGYDGADLTVRPRGHVLPENVERDLPKAVEAIRKAGLEVSMITTDISSADDQWTEPILKTTSQMGITLYRIGGWHYASGVDVTSAGVEQPPESAGGTEREISHHGSIP